MIQILFGEECTTHLAECLLVLARGLYRALDEMEQCGQLVECLNTVAASVSFQCMQISRIFGELLDGGHIVFGGNHGQVIRSNGGRWRLEHLYFGRLFFLRPLEIGSLEGFEE